MKLYSVYFDLDGVLVDSFGVHQQAWSEAFSLVGIEVTKEVTDDLRSVPAIPALQKICSRVNVRLSETALIELSNFKNHIRDREIEALCATDVYLWALEILKECRRLSVRTHCIATTRAARRILEKVGLGDSFCTVTCGEELEVPKRLGAQTLVRLVAKEKVSFDSILYLDDAPEAIEMAMREDIPSYLINAEILESPSDFWNLESLFFSATQRLFKHRRQRQTICSNEKYNNERSNNEKR